MTLGTVLLWTVAFDEDHTRSDGTYDAELWGAA